VVTTSKRAQEGTVTPTPIILKTRSKAPYALVKLYFTKPEYGTVNGRYAVVTPAKFTGAEIVGYAHSGSAAVTARCRRLGAKLLPITGGKVEVTV
jgi:hypothetical protein